MRCRVALYQLVNATSPLADKQAEEPMKQVVGAIGAIVVAGLAYRKIRAARSAPDSHDLPEAYCFSCKAKRPIKEAQTTTMKNDRTGLKGQCSVCGKGLFSPRATAA